jgi:hypothetical protein
MNMTDEEWADRLAVIVAETIRRRTERAELRRQFAVRRDHGLRQRHADQLDHAQQQGWRGGDR